MQTFGEIPNGSAWAVTTKAVPELDATHLVVGRVVEVRRVCTGATALSGLQGVPQNWWPLPAAAACIPA